ncbi:MAG TPA: Bax inhibitor-1/YccA family protein [Humisphaera sp.]|nr:Bax inhibitor-1/YccA family protein [Humisphaera sp.]
MAQFPNSRGLDYFSNRDETGLANPAVMRFFNLVYAWMCVGLALTGGVAWYASQHMDIFVRMGRGVFLLFIVELFLVMAIARAVDRINATTATLMFLVYSAINGVVLSAIFLIYAKSTLAAAFFISAGTFGAMSVFGMVTKSDLTGLGRYLIMALIGIIIASIVSIFWHNSLLQVAINYIGVLVFVGLTAYHTQKLKNIAYQTQGNEALAARYAIIGSLSLYLDFINLFLFILELLGNRRND